MLMIDENTTREKLIQVVDENLFDVIDDFMEAEVDPHKNETSTNDIRRVLINWIEACDECATCA